MREVSRRNLLAAAAAGSAAATMTAAANAASFGNPDTPPEGAINASGPTALSEPGPQNPAIASQFPISRIRRRPTSTAWTSSGPRSTTPTSAFRAAAGRVKSRRRTSPSPTPCRASTCACPPAASARCTGTSRPNGRSWSPANAASPCSTCKAARRLRDVETGDLWYFPPGLPHSLQGLGPDGCEFVLVFDNGHGVGIQHPDADRLDRAHAAGGSGEELRRSGRRRSRTSRSTISGSSRARSRRPLAADQAAVGLEARQARSRHRLLHVHDGADRDDAERRSEDRRQHETSRSPRPSPSRR